MFAKVEEDSDMSEFMLQYTSGQLSGNDNSRLLFHTAYEGPATSYTVKNLRMNAHYTFRVCGRVDKNSHWSPWSVCQTAVNTILHHSEFSFTASHLCISRKTFLLFNAKQFTMS